MLRIAVLFAFVLRLCNGINLDGLKAGAIRLRDGLHSKVESFIHNIDNDRKKRTDVELKEGIAKFYDEVKCFNLHVLVYKFDLVLCISCF